MGISVLAIGDFVDADTVFLRTSAQPTGMVVDEEDFEFGPLPGTVFVLASAFVTDMSHHTFFSMHDRFSITVPISRPMGLYASLTLFEWRLLWL